MTQPTRAGPRLDAYEHRSQDSTTTQVITTLLVVALAAQLVFSFLNRPLSSLTDPIWDAFTNAMPSSFLYGLRSHPAGPSWDLGRASISSKGHAETVDSARDALSAEPDFSRVRKTRNQQVRSPKGLGNFDHSCYQNSVLQALAAIPSVQVYFERIAALDRPGTSSKTTAALHDLGSKLNTPDGSRTYFWAPLVLKSMSSWQPQDAQEYFSKVMEAVEKEAQTQTQAQARERVQDITSGLAALRLQDDEDSKAGTAESLRDAIDCASMSAGGNKDVAPTSRIGVNPLEGLLAQRVGCIECGYCEGFSLIPFNCLTLPLGRSHAYTLEDCLDASTELELIEGVECAKCSLTAVAKQLQALASSLSSLPDQAERTINVESRLSRVQRALDEEDFTEETVREACLISKNLRRCTTKSKQVTLLRLPQCLAVHVNRSTFDLYTGAQSKNNALLDFPPSFDPRPWVVGGECYDSSSHVSSTTETWNTSPKESVLPATMDSPDSRFSYDLRALIAHHGIRHENGHYICYRPSPPPMEDASVSDDDSSEDLSEDGDTDFKDMWWRMSDGTAHPMSRDAVLAQGEAFMLFYELTESRPVAGRPASSDQVEDQHEVVEPATGESSSTQVDVPTQGLLQDPPRDPHATRHDGNSPIAPSKEVAVELANTIEKQEHCVPIHRQYSPTQMKTATPADQKPLPSSQVVEPI